ncbi:MAG: MFS transporter [Pseudomonadota bacterium]
MSKSDHKAAPGPGRLLALLFFVNFLNFFDRALPAVALEQMRAEFSLNDTMLGALGTAFVLVYAFAGIPLGRLADRTRRVSLLAVGVAVWSLLTAATGMTKNFTALLLIRLGVGVGEASCAPAANSLIGDLYPSERRSRPIGIFMLGLPLGTVTAFALGGWLVQEFGWRVPFFAAAVPGLILAVLLWFAREPLRGAQEAATVSAAASASTAQALARPFRTLLAIPTLWWLILSGAGLNFATYSLSTFLPSLLIRFHGATTASAGVVAAIVLGLTGILGLAVGGGLADAAHRRWRRGRLAFGAIALLLAAPLVAAGLAQPAGQVVMLTVLLSSGWLLLFLYYVTVYPAIQDVVHPQLRATAMAVYFLFMYVLGGGIGTFVTGALSDHFAAEAMQLANASAMTESFRAVGLRQSLLWVLPTALLVTGLAIAGSMRTYSRDLQAALGTKSES